MSYLQDATDPTAVPQRVWAGVIASDAVDMLDRVSVVIGGLNGDLRWEDAHWQPKDNITLPQEGDQCVVVMDDNGELWVVGWGDVPTYTPYVTTLPTSPYDAQEVYLVDSLTNPSYQWQFRYNAGSTSAYKWEFVGGFPAFIYIDTAESTVGDGVGRDLATVGPQFTFSHAGEYELEIVCRADKQDGAGWWTGTMYLVDGGSAITPIIQIYLNIYNPGGPIPWATGSFKGAVTIAAGHTVSSNYGAQSFEVAGQHALFSRRSLTVTPKRIS